MNRINIRNFVIVSALLASLLAAATSMAQQIRPGGSVQEPGNVAQPGCCLQANTGQPGWTLVSAPHGIPVPHAAVPVTPPSTAWASALPGSTWIGPTAASGTGNMPAGRYIYEYKFCLCGEQKDRHPVLSLSFLSDNGSTVYLNGTTTPFQIFGPTSLYSFQHPPGPFSVVYTGPLFRPCPQINTLVIAVDNQGGPTGLDAIFNVNGAAVPVHGECPCRP